jgi:hypothetical protein
MFGIIGHLQVYKLVLQYNVTVTVYCCFPGFHCTSRFLLFVVDEFLFFSCEAVMDMFMLLDLAHSVRPEDFTEVTMKNVVFWDILAQFVPHGRHITSQLQRPAG